MTTRKAPAQGPGKQHEQLSTPTLEAVAEMAKVDSLAADSEQQGAGILVPGAPFPDGGLRAWAAIAGAFLVCTSPTICSILMCVHKLTLLVFATFGYANTFGVYQDYYQFTGYPEETASAFSWIGSVQLFLQFSLGAISGPLYDRGYFYHLIISGSIIYIVWYVA